MDFAGLGHEDGAHRIGAYLFEVRQAPRSVGGHARPPVKLELRYLMTSSSQEPKEAHRALGDLLVSALEDGQFEVELEPLPATFWSAFQSVPRPCFVLRVPVFHELTEPLVPPLQAPPSVSVSGLTRLRGFVRGPGGLPIAGAVVAIESLGRRTLTSSDGQFYLESLPVEPFPTMLTVHVKGHEFPQSLHAGDFGGAPLKIDIASDLFLNTT